MEENKITITKDEYKTMVEKVIKYDLMIASIISNLRLSYNKEEITFADVDIKQITEIFENDKIRNKYATLMLEEAQKENKNE